MHDKDLYEYAVIRYVPDVEREEFINVGLLMMCKRRRWIQVETAIDSSRHTSLRSPHKVEEIQQQLSTFVDIARGMRHSGPMGSLPVEERFRWLTAVKSACLQTSRPHPGITHDLNATFVALMKRLVL